jgi:hypothetical protein
MELETAAGLSEEKYWSFEARLKQWESAFSSVVGGDGAIYAIRRKLWEPLQDSDINDFVNPLQIVAKGYRGVFDSEAWCTERPAGDFTKEFARKVRIVNRSFNGLLRVPQVLNPFLVGRFALLIFSHKLLRWFSPFILIGHLFFSVMALGANDMKGAPCDRPRHLYPYRVLCACGGRTRTAGANPETFNLYSILFLPHELCICTRNLA